MEEMSNRPLCIEDNIFKGKLQVMLTKSLLMLNIKRITEMIETIREMQTTITIMTHKRLVPLDSSSRVTSTPLVKNGANYDDTDAKPTYQVSNNQSTNNNHFVVDKPLIYRAYHIVACHNDDDHNADDGEYI